jgi:putative oxidoreductase
MPLARFTDPPKENVMTFLDKYRDAIYALTRIVAGFLFSQHGAQKLFGAFGGAPAEMPAPLLYTAGGIEFFGGMLIALGLFTRPAAFLSSGLMAAAYFMAHQPNGALPIQNHGELAALYCWLFLLISAHGDGIWSLGSRSAQSA